jgi:CrcB protein
VLPTGHGRTVDGVLQDLLGRYSVARVRAAAVLTGGAVGTLARAGVAEALPRRPGEWPWATFIVNLFGALLLGWLLTRLAERVAPRRYWRFLLGTGFCGAVTTFSTFQIETFDLVRTGHAGVAISYALGSIVAGMAVAVLGVMVARWGRHW